MEYIKRRKLEMSRLIQELEHSKNKMMVYEEEHHMLKQRMKELESMRYEMRHHRDILLGDDTENPEIESIMSRYADLSDEYAQVRHSLESSSMKHKEMQMHMMKLEKEVSHSMKIIGQ